MKRRLIKNCISCSKEMEKPYQYGYEQFAKKIYCSNKCARKNNIGIPLSKKVKEKISITKLSQKRKMPEENRLKLIKANTGRKQTPEHIKNAFKARGFDEDLLLFSQEEKAEHRYFYQIKRKFGMTREEYKNILEEQNGVCAICKDSKKNTRRLAVDHCHKTEKIRGLLCLDCNWTLGRVEDNPSLLEKMINYLK